MKNLEGYKLGVVIDAQAAAALKALASTDAAAGKVSQTFADLEKASAASVKGLASALGKKDLTKAQAAALRDLAASGKAAFAALEKDAERSTGRIRGLLSKLSGNIRLSASGGAAGSGLGAGTVAGLAAGGVGLAASALTSVLGPLVSGLKDAALEGIDFNATLESANISLTRLLGSSQAATAHIKELQKAAADSPANFEGLLELDQLLQNAGVSAKGLPKLLADVATGVGQLAGTKGLDDRLNRVAVQIAQMSSLGQVQNEDLKALQENLIPAYDLLAKALGKTTKQVKELAAAGQLEGKAVGEILLRQLADVGKKSGDAVRNSYAVLSSNLQDLKQQASGIATQEAFGTIKRGMAGVTGSSDAVTNAAASANKAIGAVLKPMEKLFAQIAKGEFYSAGNAIADGVAAGISDHSDFIDKAAVDMALGAWKAFKQAADIKSPSGLMQAEGKQLPLGVAAGITDPEALAAIEKAVGSMMILIENKTAEGIARTRKRIAEGLAKVPEIQAMLATIGKSEGAGYTTKVGGGTSASVATGQKDRSIVNLGRGLKSSADGRYQFLNKTWDAVAGQLGLSDFSAQSQDLAAIQLMRQRGMIAPLLKGDVAGSLRAGNREWASLPGSPYGQHTNSASKLSDFFASALGKAGSAPKAPQTSGFALGNAERFALYNPSIGTAKVAPGSVVIEDPGRTAATQLLSLSESKPLGVTINGGEVVTDIKASSEAMVALADVNKKFLASPGFDLTTKVQQKAGAVKAELFGLERSAPTESETRPGSDKEVKERAIRGTSLFAGLGAQIEGPQTAIGQQATAAQGAAAGLTGAFKEVKKLGEETFGQWSQGIGSMVSNWVLLGETGPAALKKMTAQVLASAAAESATLAIVETAKGFAALATYDPVSASEHFTAAGIFAGVAGGAALVGRAIAGNSFKNNQSNTAGNNGENKDVTSEAYAGNQFRRDIQATKIGYTNYQNDQQAMQTNQLLGVIINKLNPVNGQQMVLATLKDNPRAVARANVEGVNGDFATGNRLGQRIAG